jgi:hypothetical protein
MYLAKVYVNFGLHLYMSILIVVPCGCLVMCREPQFSDKSSRGLSTGGPTVHGETQTAFQIHRAAAQDDQQDRQKRRYTLMPCSFFYVHSRLFPLTKGSLCSHQIGKRTWVRWRACWTFSLTPAQGKIIQVCCLWVCQCPSMLVLTMAIERISSPWLAGVLSGPYRSVK